VRTSSVLPRRGAAGRHPAAPLLALAATLLLAACGAGAGSSSIPTPPPGPTGTVEGTVTVDSGSASAASARSQPAPSHTAGPARRPRSLPEPDRIVAGLRPGTQAHTLSVSGARLLRASRSFAVFKPEPGQSAEAVMDRLRSLPQVAWVARDAYAFRQAEPNDALYARQWHYPAIGLPQAWDTTTGSPVIVAVVDTGVRPDHPDLQGLFVAGYDFFDSDNDPTDPGCSADPTDWSHGTHVAGTIAALTNNGRGVAGVTWGGTTPIRIMPLRALGEDQRGVRSRLHLRRRRSHRARRPERRQDHQPEPRLGLGPPRPAQRRPDRRLPGCGPRRLGRERPLRRRPVPRRLPRGHRRRRHRLPRPARVLLRVRPQVFIAAPGGGAASPSPCGTTPDFVLSTSHNLQDGNTYVWMAGTSMAAPHVSGVAALLFGRGWTTPAANPQPPAGHRHRHSPLRQGRLHRVGARERRRRRRGRIHHLPHGGVRVCSVRHRPRPEPRSRRPAFRGLLHSLRPRGAGRRLRLAGHQRKPPARPRRPVGQDRPRHGPGRPGDLRRAGDRPAVLRTGHRRVRPSNQVSTMQPGARLRVLTRAVDGFGEPLLGPGSRSLPR
jgi:hypothetical protein